MKENAKYWRLGLFGVAILMSLFAGLKQGNGTGGLMFVGVVSLLALPYLFSDWILPEIRKKREKQPDAGSVLPQTAPQPPEPAPQAPVTNAPQVQKSAAARSKWQISWESCVLDDICLVYEKAEANDNTAWKLYQLETQALAECRDRLGMAFPELEAKGFNALSGTEKEIVIAQLGGMGIIFNQKNTDIQNRTITVTLSPVIQSVMACSFFKLLNWLEKLDGSLNEMVDGRVTLHFLVPLGGRKGLVQWETLILELYPWLGIKESSSNLVAVEPTPVEVPAPAQENDSVGKVRERIISALAVKAAKEYEVGSLLWEDARECFDGDWDGAWFQLDLETARLRVQLGTYPNAFGASRSDSRPISASDFHRIAEKYNFDPELQAFVSDADWEKLFNSELKAAVSAAKAKLEQSARAQAAKDHEKYAIEVPANGRPKMDLKRVTLMLNQRFGSTHVTVSPSEGSYLVECACSYTSVTDNRTYRRQLSPAEAAWVEKRVERTIADPNQATWQSIPGGDTLIVIIHRANAADISQSFSMPSRKYTDLLNDLEKLAHYGSK